MHKEFNIIDCFYILNKWRVKILALIILGIIIGILKSVITPILYNSAALALLPLEQSSQSESRNLYFNKTIFPRGSLAVDTAISIITSRRMYGDIVKHFNLTNKPHFKMRVIAYPWRNCIFTEIRGTDPQLTKDIANFCVYNVDKIGAELNIAIEKPMLRMLDSADYGMPVSNDITKGIVVGGLFAVICSLTFIFFIEYISFIRIRKKL